MAYLDNTTESFGNKLAFKYMTSGSGFGVAQDGEALDDYYNSGLAEGAQTPSVL